MHLERLSLVVLLSGSALVAACSSMKGTADTSAATADVSSAMAAAKVTCDQGGANQVRIQDEAGSVVVQKVEFKSGVSSATVERLARQFGCTGSTGAGLVTDKGPVEVYRMQCDNGSNFLARCELRQCRPLR